MPSEKTQCHPTQKRNGDITENSFNKLRDEYKNSHHGI
jgi:hypothetical protein